MSDTKREDREKLLDRIRHMQQRTVDNGCTEAEAMTAAALVAKLMDKFGFEQTDLELKLEPVTETSWFSKDKQLGRITYVTNAIAQYCDCKVWMSKRYTNGSLRESIQFFGRESDVAVATYMTHLLHTAMFSAWVDYRPTRPQHVKLTHARRAFELGFCARVSKRLREMKAERNASISPETGKTGQSLVVIKNQVVTEAFAAKHLRLRTRPAMQAKSADAWISGAAAGDKVRINQGVSGTTVKRIGGN